MRTDDGEAICSYIDLFQKSPEKALVCVCVCAVLPAGFVTLGRSICGYIPF